MFVYLQKLLHYLIIYSYKTNPLFSTCHEINDESDLAILINKVKMIDDGVSSKAMLYVYKDLNVYIHVR